LILPRRSLPPEETSSMSTPSSLSLVARMVVCSIPLFISSIICLSQMTYHQAQSPLGFFSGPSSSSSQSLALNRTKRGLSHAFRVISVISVMNRSRFSREPPYLSVRLLEMGDRNSDHQLCLYLKRRERTVHEVPVGTVDLDEIVSNLLTSVDGF
jgi:hypothetical protein